MSFKGTHTDSIYFTVLASDKNDKILVLGINTNGLFAFKHINGMVNITYFNLFRLYYYPLD